MMDACVYPQDAKHTFHKKGYPLSATCVEAQLITSIPKLIFVQLFEGAKCYVKAKGYACSSNPISVNGKDTHPLTE